MKKCLSLLLTLALCAALCVPALAAEFSDVPAGHTFHDAIQDCAAKGITSGYADGSFKPAATVTRAQFCVMLVRALYPGEEEAYAHLQSSGWFITSAAVLDAHGLQPVQLP